MCLLPPHPAIVHTVIHMDSFKTSLLETLSSTFLCSLASEKKNKLQQKICVLPVDSHIRCASLSLLGQQVALLAVQACECCPQIHRT